MGVGVWGWGGQHCRGWKLPAVPCGSARDRRRLSSNAASSITAELTNTDIVLQATEVGQAWVEVLG